MGPTKVANYMVQLLDELGWNKGTRIPLASPGNKELETVLLSRQDEIQQLKEALILQNQKRDDLNKYKLHVQTESQENTKLLLAHKQQLEQMVKLKHLSCNEADRLCRDITLSNKQSNEITTRIEKLQAHAARFLKKADILKVEVCGERGALEEWRASLECSADDISSIEKYTKQDISKAKALETKRQKLKLEHDRVEDSLKQLVSNLNGEERVCDRISIQVMEGMEQRKQMMAMWTSAVENLRQRDTDIRHTREDYAVLEEEANLVAERCREQQAFFEQQQGNNAEAERKNMEHMQQLSHIRNAQAQLVEQQIRLHSEAQALQRELHNVHSTVEKLNAENRRLQDEQKRKNEMLQALVNKITELKEKRIDSMDKSKSSEKRAKELKDMLNEEERYANQLSLNQQRAMHCSFVESQNLLALKNEEKLFHMQLKASKAIMNKYDTKQQSIEKNLLNQKEVLYSLTYRVETTAAHVSHMEGSQAEREFSAEKLEREKRLQTVAARHAARVALLERHAARLNDDMRCLVKELETRTGEHIKLQSRLKTSLLDVQGGEKELRVSREVWRRARVEQALFRLRVAHAERSVAGLGDSAYTIDKQRLQLDAAMNERLVEIGARRDMFSVQKRELLEDCGKLRSEILEREMRIEQLKKRYDIFIASLGKDDSGEKLTVAFFKIKFAAERAELRERGAALDADIGRCERDIAALEATLRVMHVAHKHFLRNVTPLKEDTPEIEELHSLQTQYYEQRDELQRLSGELAQLEQRVADVATRHAALSDKRDQLEQRESETDNELEGARDRVSRQETRLENAREVVRTYMKRARKLFEDTGDLQIMQMHLWYRDYNDATYDALRALVDACSGMADATKQLSKLMEDEHFQQRLSKQQRRMQTLVNRFITDSATHIVEHIIEGSSFSSSSSSRARSVKGGYAHRLAMFREDLAEKLQEKTLTSEESSQGQRSAMSLRVVTLGLEESAGGLVSRSAIQSRSHTRSQY